MDWSTGAGGGRPTPLRRRCSPEGERSPDASLPKGVNRSRKGEYELTQGIIQNKPMKQNILSVGKGIDRVIDLLKTFTGYTIFVFMALLCFQVIMRFVFKNPIYGIDEAVTALMIWSMSLGWCTVYWDNEHAVLEFIMKKMPTWFRRIMFNITNFIILIITVAYIPASWTLFNMQKKMPPVGGLPFCKAYYYALPVLVMSLIMLVLCSYKTIAFLLTGDESVCAPVVQEGGSVVD